jgi:hypothetical protein
MKARVRSVSYASVVAITAVFGCAPQEHKLAADGTGDLSYVLQDRSAPDSRELEECGDGAAIEGRNPLPRGPYLQQVGARSAKVVFTTLDEGPMLVDVTKPDGSPVASVTAERDESASLAGGAWQAVAQIDELEPSTLYCYAIRDNVGRAGFRTAPPDGSETLVRFAAFGDSGTGGEYQRAVLDQMFTVPFDFVLHMGDMAYSSGTLGQLEDQYFDVYPALIKSFSVFPIAGNHEHGSAGAAPFRQVFVLPENGAPAGVELYYSFDWGNVHFVALDTELTNAAQAAWLDADLAATDKPWKIVFGHKPPYSSGEHGNYGAFRTQFGPIIQKHGVQLVLNGHDHDYERTMPVDGTIYVVTGGGGRHLRPVGSSSFTAFSEDVHHFVSVEVHSNELLLHAIDGAGTEFDSARIVL